MKGNEEKYNTLLNKIKELLLQSSETEDSTLVLFRKNKSKKIAEHILEALELTPNGALMNFLNNPIEDFDEEDFDYIDYYVNYYKEDDLQDDAAAYAEKQGRFSIRTSAAYLGISRQAFVAACVFIDYIPQEAYLREVNDDGYVAYIHYYDTKFLKYQKEFWKAAETKVNKKYIAARIAEIEAGMQVKVISTRHYKKRYRD